jgi:hypothetical protein
MIAWIRRRGLLENNMALTEFYTELLPEAAIPRCYFAGTQSGTMPVIGSERGFVIAVGAMFIGALIIASYFHTVSLRQAVRVGAVALAVVVVLCFLIEPPRRDKGD